MYFHRVGFGSQRMHVSPAYPILPDRLQVMICTQCRNMTLPGETGDVEGEKMRRTAEALAVGCCLCKSDENLKVWPSRCLFQWCIDCSPACCVLKQNSAE